MLTPTYEAGTANMAQKKPAPFQAPVQQKNEDQKMDAPKVTM